MYSLPFSVNVWQVLWRSSEVFSVKMAKVQLLWLHVPACTSTRRRQSNRVMESLCISAYEGKCRSLAGLVWDNLDFIWITFMKTATKLQKLILKMMWDIFFLIKSLRNDLFAFLFWRYRETLWYFLISCYITIL